jgi:Mce-associated membrane protein
VTAAGLEDVTPTEAKVLVAVSVKTSALSEPDQRPRAWRMRISVQREQADIKVSNVEFVA